LVHEAANTGFAAAPDAYDRARPGYPGAAVDWLWTALALKPGDAVADVGAGTGKLSVPLATHGARISAIEPVDAMRERLETRLPDAATHDAPAENLPIAGGSMVAVVAGQAFHWFANDDALAEFHRVLVPDGRLGLIWNRRDLDDPVQAAISALIEPHADGVPRHAANDWGRVLERSELFGPRDSHELAFTQELDRDGLADRVGSTSFIAAMPDAERRPLLDRVRDLAGPDGRARIAYVCEVFVYDRLA
jgi:SAM-dependent methyltransferase